MCHLNGRLQSDEGFSFETNSQSETNHRPTNTRKCDTIYHLHKHPWLVLLPVRRLACQTTRTPSMSVKYTEPVVTKTSSRSHKPSDRARFVAALSLTSWEILFHRPTCEQQLNFFNSSIRTLLDTHLPEREIRRCSSNRPWIHDNLRYLIRRHQNSGNQLHRKKANRERKSSQRKYY